MSMINFITESLRIEGIRRPPTEAEINEMSRFMDLDIVTIADLMKFVSVYQPDAELRDHESVPGVYIGGHTPKSGPRIRKDLQSILNMIGGVITPYEIHQLYEDLHPFTDGNGFSARALWAWQMQKDLGVDAMDVVWGRGFLHTWYYQSLRDSRRLSKPPYSLALLPQEQIDLW